MATDEPKVLRDAPPAGDDDAAADPDVVMSQSRLNALLAKTRAEGRAAGERRVVDLERRVQQIIGLTTAVLAAQPPPPPPQKSRTDELLEKAARDPFGLTVEESRELGPGGIARAFSVFATNNHQRK